MFVKLCLRSSARFEIDESMNCLLDATARNLIDVQLKGQPTSDNESALFIHTYLLTSILCVHESFVLTTRE